MTKDNIYERRAYIKNLIENNEEVYVRDLARQWNSSPAAIMADIRVLSGHKYCENKSSKTQNIRARKMGVSGIISEADWQRVLKKYGYKCVCCGTKKGIALDHIIPISRCGTNTIDNVQPLCKKCNSSKRDKTIDYRKE